MEIKLKKSTLKRVILSILIFLFITFVVIFIFSNKAQKEVLIQTNYGNITVQLDYQKAPTTSQNFEDYVKSGFYDGTVFHRIIKNFMIQGGGYAASGTQKETNVPIILESNNGLKNLKYTIAMARTSDPNSATSQFFINTADNGFLDYTVGNPGYAVFGKVVSGFDTVDKIESVETEIKNGMQNWPKEEVIIKKVSLV